MACRSTNSEVQDLFAKLLEKRFDRQPCCAGILYECMRFLIGHCKVNAAQERACSHGTSSRVCLYQPYNQCRLVLRAWHPPRSRSEYIVSISTGPTRRQLRDNAAARSIVIGGEEAYSVSAGRPAVWSAVGRFCSLIPGLGVKLSNDILAGPTVLSAVGVSPPHDGVR